MSLLSSAGQFPLATPNLCHLQALTQFPLHQQSRPSFPGLSALGTPRALRQAVLTLLSGPHLALRVSHFLYPQGLSALPPSQIAWNASLSDAQAPFLGKGFLPTIKARSESVSSSETRSPSPHEGWGWQNPLGIVPWGSLTQP